MTDRKLLELAAKAAGVAPVLCYESARNCLRIGDRKGYALWRPITDDGDALRLAAALKIDLEWQATGPFPDPDVEAYRRTEDGSYFCASEHESDYRRAIVRVAAEIGKAMA